MESTDSSTGSQQLHLPPGFRFHPTDEELVVHYLKKKVASSPMPVEIIAEVDLYKFDPWELPAKATFGEQEWYFFSPRDRKYPNGARPNRVATSGYWKATGTDKPVLTAGGNQNIGVKKALVFYGGKPPKGMKTNWIMHEYRLTGNKPSNTNPPGCDVASKKGSLRLDDWVLCRIYKKKNTPQMPIDQEREDINDMLGSIPPNILMPAGQQKLQGLMIKPTNYASFLENDHTKLYEGATFNDSLNSHLCSSGSKPAPQLPNWVIGSPNLLPSKRSTLPNLYWNHEGNTNSDPTKGLIAENCDGSFGRTDETTNSIATILSQLPQTPSLQQQQQAMLGNLGEGVFRQSQAYQVSGMNWYS